MPLRKFGDNEGSSTKAGHHTPKSIMPLRKFGENEGARQERGTTPQNPLCRYESSVKMKILDKSRAPHPNIHYDITKVRWE